MLEHELQTKFTAWLKSPEGLSFVRSHGGAVAFELKMAKEGKDSVSLAVFAEHQIKALADVEGLEGNGFVYKIPDSAFGYKPFDCFAMSQAAGYVVVGFKGLEDRGLVALCLPIRLIRPLYAFKKKTGMRGGVISYSAFKSLGRVIEL